MTYLATGPRRVARTVRGGGGALGDAVGDLVNAIKGTGIRPPSGVSPATFLVGQVNRFGDPRAPEGIRFHSPPFALPPSGSVMVPEDAGLMASILMQRRLADAVDDETTIAIRNEAFQHIGDYAWVNQHASEIGSVLAAFGNQLGLPAAKYPGHIPMALVGGAALVAVVGGFLYLNRRR